MCGFAGIVTWDNRHRVHRDVLERMSARIAHRGPDGAGLWINHEEEATAERPQVGLVHRRLAIRDPISHSLMDMATGWCSTVRFTISARSAKNSRNCAPTTRGAPPATPRF